MIGFSGLGNEGVRRFGLLRGRMQGCFGCPHSIAGEDENARRDDAPSLHGKAENSGAMRVLRFGFDLDQ